MSSTDRSRWWHRVDVRLGLMLALVFSPLIALVLATLYAFSASELLELAQLEVDERLVQLESALAEPDDALRDAQLVLLGQQLARDDGGYLALGADDAVLFSGGASISRAGDGGAASRWLGALRVGSSDSIRGERQLASGGSLLVEISGQDFVRERDEIQRGFWISLALGIVLAAVGAVPATRYALEPLRRATVAARDVDPSRLARRLPVRGTRDDVDLHAEAVNRSLDRLEEGFERIRRFSQDVAHELRTPVNRILNVTEIALLDPAIGDRASRDLESIHENVDHLARTIDGLLLLARSEEGSLRPVQQRVDLGGLCRTLADLYRPACEEKGLRLEVDADAPGEVLGDPTLLVRAIGNLIDNAIRYTPSGGRVRLEATPSADAEGSWVEIGIADSGPGVAVEDRRRIFERFVRIDGRPASGDPATEDSQRGGVGLGLAIARGLVRAHHGDLDVRKAAEGGARFVVRLPRARSA